MVLLRKSSTSIIIWAKMISGILFFHSYKKPKISPTMKAASIPNQNPLKTNEKLNNAAPTDNSEYRRKIFF